MRVKIGKKLVKSSNYAERLRTILKDWAYFPRAFIKN